LTGNVPDDLESTDRDPVLGGLASGAAIHAFDLALDLSAGLRGLQPPDLGAGLRACLRVRERLAGAVGK
jgi:hypothetical protein